MSYDDISYIYSLFKRNSKSRPITNSKLIQNSKEIKDIKEIKLIQNSKNIKSEVYPLLLFDTFEFLNVRKMVRCRGKEIYLPSVDYDITFNIYNDDEVDVNVYLETGKCGNVVTIRNLMNSVITIYNNENIICTLKKSEFSLYLVYSNFNKIIFLPVKIEK